MTDPKSLIILYGPKGAGKTRLARRLEEALGVHRLDADVLIPKWLADGVEPDPDEGWLAPISQAITSALQLHAVVCVEATGAWESDWKLAERFEAEGVRVIKVWIAVPLDESLARLKKRQGSRVPVSDAEAREIHARATANAKERSFDLELDGTLAGYEADGVKAVGVLLSRA